MTFPGGIRDDRYLCLGGSFDPPHLGHLITSRAAAESFGFAGVRLIPSAGNPHKAGGPIASNADRLAMLRAAVGEDRFYIVDDRELRRPPPSYTFDTVSELSAETGRRVPWLVGTDLLPRLHTWHRFDELLAITEVVVMRRADHTVDLSGLDPRVADLASRAIEVPALPFSSTAIRAALANGLPTRGLPDAVAKVIHERQLYQTDR